MTEIIRKGPAEEHPGKEPAPRTPCTICHGWMHVDGIKWPMTHGRYFAILSCPDGCGAVGIVANDEGLMVGEKSECRKKIRAMIFELMALEEEIKD